MASLVKLKPFYKVFGKMAVAMAALYFVGDQNVTPLTLNEMHNSLLQAQIICLFILFFFC
jgi:hypothetical protein